MKFLHAEWPVADVVAGTTLRGGGESQGAFASLNLGAHVGDDPVAVSRNREHLRQSLAAPAEPRWLTQVHGTYVAMQPSQAESADASVTHDRGVVCVVLTADCLPVLLASRDGSVVGAAHAGWRGLCAGVLEATVAAMGAPGDQLVAWLGPAISQSAFEVGDEVRAAFVERSAQAREHFTANARGRWQADLYGLARMRLAAAGVNDVFGGDRCTYAEEDAFFSFRRDGQCGRMASVIWRRSLLKNP